MGEDRCVASENRRDPGKPGDAAQPSRPWALILAVTCGLLLGIGVTVALTADSDDNGQLTAPLDDADPSVLDPDDGPPPPGTPAPTPRAAVEGFLAAEMEGDIASSFGFLSARARARFGSPAGWIARHADILAPVTSYEIQQAEEPGDGREPAKVTTLVTFEPGLNEVVGLIPERSLVTWVAAAEDDSWGVDLDASTREPLYPSDESAPAAVRAWAEAHQACRPAPTWDGNLQGSPALAERLCGTDDALEVGNATSLTGVDAAPFLAAFGPGATGWARVVEVDGPVELAAVVAPIGQQWLVIGVLPR